MIKEQLKSLSKNAIALNPDAFTAKEKKAQWIGRRRATKAEIKAAETRLGVKLPQDVVDFYKTTNGTSEILSHMFSEFMPIDSVNWLKNLIPETLENYAGMGETYTNDLKNSIVLAGVNHVPRWIRNIIWRCSASFQLYKIATHDKSICKKGLL